MTLLPARQGGFVRCPSVCSLLFIAAVLLLINILPVTVFGQGPLMRFPDIHGNLIVFVHGEDIWKVRAEGGIAERLTIHDGAERYPKFSPDGSLIAFTGEYDGNADVYVMDVYGGNIKRVTYHPGADEVIGWHPVKNKIMFRSSRSSFSRFDRLFLVAPDGTGLEELPLHEAARGCFSPDGGKIAYNRVAREHRTWKRYRGGLAQDVYLYDFDSGTDRKLTTFEGTDRLPMWIENTIFFSSDRDGVLNIYAYDVARQHIAQVTRHREYDVRRPSEGGDAIVYELGGSLWVLDAKTGKTHRVPVEIKADDPEVRPYIKKVSADITDVDCSPDGSHALVVARGEVFSVSKESGLTRNLTKDPGARDKDAVWSPDGKRVAYLSDKSGEYEVYIVDPLGKEEAVRLTNHHDDYRHTLRWSPDSRKIAFTDQTLTLYVLDVGTKTITRVDKADFESVDVSLDRKPIADYSWSPDSRFIAYAKMNKDLVYQVYVYSLETGESRSVSNGLFHDFNPVFSPDGRRLFFVSNRRFSPTFGDFEWEMVYKKVAGIYCLTLRKDDGPLLPILTDDESPGDGSMGAGGTVDASSRVVIDFDGIARRVEVLPLARGNYRNLAVTTSDVFYRNKDEGDFNRFEFRAVGPMDLYAFSLVGRKQRTVIKGIDQYEISADGSAVVYRKGGKVGIIPASSSDSKGDELDLGYLKMRFDPMAEWNQIFLEAWRMERDYYYEPNMHGIDWNAMKDKYGKLLPFASCRQDVQYIIGELIGELNTSHTYVWGGDRKRKARHLSVGMLGVDWEMDAKNNRYRFKKIYRVPDWTQEIMSPLTRPGMNVTEGDYLLKVNDVEVTADRNIYSYFEDMADKPVTITVNSQPTLAGAREYVVKPLSGERTLRYLDWVEHNRRLADRESNGTIGYIHLPDTYLGSAREFPKYFYSQTRKKGLIIDGRFNGGGLDPDIFLQRLGKRLLAYWTRRYSHDQTTPAVVTQAHMVCLTNRQAGSGGDMLPMEFKMKKLGPVIGTRSWGGLVGVSMFIPLIDGGVLTAPDYRIYSPDGKWIVENTGVEPDIEVDLDPGEMMRGYDAQLMKAIEVLKKKIGEEPRPWPKHEPYPVQE